VLYRALTGDRSDNIRGLPRFPRRAARDLAREFGSAEALYDALHHTMPPVLQHLTPLQPEKLHVGAQLVHRNARLIDLLKATENPHLSQPGGDWAPLHSLSRELELTGLFQSLEQLLRTRPVTG
jgi:5'-3' exonuclease